MNKIIIVDAQELRDAYTLEFDGKPTTDEAWQIAKQIKADIRNAEKAERAIERFYGNDNGNIWSDILMLKSTAKAFN